MSRTDPSAGRDQPSEPGNGLFETPPPPGPRKAAIIARRSWLSRLRIGPLGPVTLGVFALSFVALLISGRLRLLYPQPRTVIAKPAEPKAVIPPISGTKPGESLGVPPQTAPRPDPIGSGLPGPAPTATPKTTPRPLESGQNQGF